MRILQINSVCGFGSTGRIAVDLYKTIVNCGHEGKIAYGRGNAPKEINTIKISSDIDNKGHVLLTRVTDKHGFGSENSTYLLIDNIKEYSPDVIHLHNIHGYYLNIEILFNYLSQMDMPVIWTLHDCWAFTGHCTYFDYVNCSRWESGCHDCPQKHCYPSSKLLDNSKRNYEHKKKLFTSLEKLTIVTPSSWLAAHARKSFLGGYPIKLINNGIDLTLFKPMFVNETEKNEMKRKYQCKDKYLILGVANIWDRRKGIEYFIELSKILDDQYKIIIVGITDRQKKRLPANIIGITRTGNVLELAELYSMADVFINPTLEDNFPTTNLEALACGIPVITFQTGGSPEAIDETCGKVVEKGSADGLIGAINYIRANPVSSKACVARAKLFDKNDKFAEYIALYEQILQKN